METEKEILIRLDRIEKKAEASLQKIDDFIHKVMQTENDIKWVNGFVKLSMTAMFSLVTGLIILLLNTRA